MLYLVQYSSNSNVFYKIYRKNIVLKIETKNLNDIKVTNVKIENEKGAEALKRKIGNYITIDLDNLDGEEDFDEDALHMRQLLKTKLVDLDLSVRALNCLKSAEVETLAELVSFNRNDLLKFRNFGKKSLVELDEKLLSLNLSFGMDISKYKLDKE